MKKFLSIALILALAVGTVFAGKSSGSAELDFGFDLDKMEYGFKNSSAAKFSGSFAFDTSDLKTGSEGEKDLHAKIAAKFGAQIKWSEGGIVFDKVTAKITEASIIYKDLTVGILSAGGGYDYAASYRTDDDGDPIYHYVEDIAGVPGFTVAYKGIGQIGFGFEGKAESAKGANDGKINLLVQAQTDALKLVDDQLTLQFAATYAKQNWLEAKGIDAITSLYTFVKPDGSVGTSIDPRDVYVYKDGKNTGKVDSKKVLSMIYSRDAADAVPVDVVDVQALFANAKVGFANDSLSANLGLDFTYNLLKKDVKEAIDVEARLDFTFSPVTLNAYFDLLNKKLDVQLVGDVKVNDDFTVTATAFGQELLDYADGGAIEFGGKVGANYSGISGELSAGFKLKQATLNLGASVGYTSDVVSASVGLKGEVSFADADKKAPLKSLGLMADVSSSALIDGATVGIKYESYDAKGKAQEVDFIAKQKGVITAYATIGF